MDSSRFGYMLSSEAIKVVILRCFVESRGLHFDEEKENIWRMHRTYVSFWVVISKEVGGGHSLLYFAYTYAQDLFSWGLITLQKRS